MTTGFHISALKKYIKFHQAGGEGKVRDWVQREKSRILF
jgi:hypothetical protein